MLIDITINPEEGLKGFPSLKILFIVYGHYKSHIH